MFAISDQVFYTKTMKGLMIIAGETEKIPCKIIWTGEWFASPVINVCNLQPVDPDDLKHFRGENFDASAKYITDHQYLKIEYSSLKPPSMSMIDPFEIRYDCYSDQCIGLFPPRGKCLFRVSATEKKDAKWNLEIIAAGTPEPIEVL